MSDVQLRVALEAVDARLTPRTGHGRVWHELVKGLRDRVDLAIAWPRRRRPWQLRPPRADVWLVDGHRAPRSVGAPLVSLVHEAGWNDSLLRSFLDETFATRVARDTEIAVRASSRIVTPSEASRADVISNYGVDGSIVDCVPYGVDLSRFRPGIPGGDTIVARHTGSKPTPYVLFVGTATPRKNLPTIVGAMAQLEDTFEHCLVLVFSGVAGLHSEPLIDAVTSPRGTMGERRVVVVHDPTDDELAALMSGATAFTLPSYWEGFGLPALEAMACGTPVVVSGCGSLPELVDGAGVVVQPVVDEFAAALERILGDAREADRLGNIARRRAESFPWSRTVDGCLRALQCASDKTLP